MNLSITQDFLPLFCIGYSQYLSFLPILSVKLTKTKYSMCDDHITQRKETLNSGLDISGFK